MRISYKKEHLQNKEEFLEIKDIGTLKNSVEELEDKIEQISWKDKRLRKQEK